MAHSVSSAFGAYVTSYKLKTPSVERETSFLGTVLKYGGGT